MKYLSITIKKIALSCMLFFPLLALAQPKDNSPYSRFGIGDIVDDNFMASHFMGGLGGSFIDPYHVNIVNPASLSYLGATSFEVGLHAELSRLSDGIHTPASRWNGNLNYISFAFPLQNALNDILDRKKRNLNFGMGFTLMPYSNVGYDVSSYLYNENFGDYTVNYQGSGGSYQFLWSNGVRFKNFAFGLNLGYLFGKINNTTVIGFAENPASFNSFLENNSSMSGFVWKAGLLYNLHLTKKDEDESPTDSFQKIVFGLYGNSTTTLNSTTNSIEGSLLNISGLIIQDTFSLVNGEKKQGKLPSEFGFGVSYVNGNKFSIGVNYESTQWSKFNSDFVNNNLKNTFKLSFGGYYRPNYKSVSSYLSRVSYRLGTFYQKVPVEINQGEEIDDYGLTFGLGMPFFYQRKISHANLGFTYGMRGTGTAIEERYFRISFSFTFNDDEWFINKKYN